MLSFLSVETYLLMEINNTSLKTCITVDAVPGRLTCFVKLQILVHELYLNQKWLVLQVCNQFSYHLQNLKSWLARFDAEYVMMLKYGCTFNILTNNVIPSSWRKMF